jgi:hypothetical protein
MRERVGYEIAHSIIDDHSRLAYTELHCDEKATTVAAFLDRALQFYAVTGSQLPACRPTTSGPTPTTALSPSCSLRTR